MNCLIPIGIPSFISRKPVLACMLFGLFSFEVLGAGIRPLACTTVIAPRLHLRDFLPQNTIGQSVLSAALKGDLDGNLRIAMILEQEPLNRAFSFRKVLFLKLSEAGAVSDSDPSNTSHRPDLKFKGTSPKLRSSQFNFYLDLILKNEDQFKPGHSSHDSPPGEIIARLEFAPETLEILSAKKVNYPKVSAMLTQLNRHQDWVSAAKAMGQWIENDFEAIEQRKRVLNAVANFEPQVDTTGILFASPSNEEPLVTEFRIEGASPRTQNQWRELFANRFGPDLLSMTQYSMLSPELAFPMDLVLGRFKEFLSILSGPGDLREYADWLQTKYPIDGLRSALLALKTDERMRSDGAKFADPIRELLAVWTLEIFLKMKNQLAKLVNDKIINPHEIIAPGFPFQSAAGDVLIFLKLGESIPTGFAIFAPQDFANNSYYLDKLAEGIHPVQPDGVLKSILPQYSATATISFQGFHAYHDLAHLLGLIRNPTYMRKIRSLANAIRGNRKSNPPKAGRKIRQFYLIENFMHPREEQLDALFVKYDVSNLWSCQSLDCVEATLRNMPRYLEFVSELWKNRHSFVESLGGIGVGFGQLFFRVKSEHDKSKLVKEIVSDKLPGPTLRAETAFDYRYPGTALIFFLVRTGQLSLEQHFDGFLAGDHEILKAYQALLDELPQAAQRMFEDEPN